MASSKDSLKIWKQRSPFLICGGASLLCAVLSLSFYSHVIGLRQLEADSKNVLAEVELEDIDSVIAQSTILTLARRVLADAGAFVNVSARVAPNPVNTLAEQLKKKETSLNERQKNLDKQAQAINQATLQQELSRQTRSTKISLGLAILISLLSLHLYFDYRHKLNDKKLLATTK